MTEIIMICRAVIMQLNKKMQCLTGRVFFTHGKTALHNILMRVGCALDFRNLNAITIQFELSIFPATNEKRSRRIDETLIAG